MRCLLDGDMLNYEIAFAAEARWKYEHIEKGETPEGVPPFGYVTEMCDKRVEEILRVTESTKKPLVFFTGSGNFRFDIAFTQPYKERSSPKPHYYTGVKAYLESKFTCHEKDGLEADDLIAIMMSTYPDAFICCSRDKDLRQVPGWHYSWELNHQPQFGPIKIDELGFLELNAKRKIVGGGDKFFFSQLLMGDRVDTIPGIPGTGPVTAYNLLKDCKSYEECLEVVKREYQLAYGLYWPEVMREQGNLLRLVREVKEGSPVLWEFRYNQE